MLSFLNTLPTENSLTGYLLAVLFANWLIYLADTLVVCVLRSACWASSSFHASFQFFTCIFFTLFMSAMSSTLIFGGFFRKNVSCMSLVGWSWGENNASKFQNADSIIGPDTSVKPMLNHASLMTSINS